MNGKSIFIVIILRISIVLLFVLHVEANLNPQRHNNTHLRTIVSFLKGDFFLGHTVQLIQGTLSIQSAQRARKG